MTALFEYAAQETEARAVVAGPWSLAEWPSLVAAIVNDEWGVHDLCTLTACRTPLHPGPCKGWKHTLHATAPGVFHTLEKARVEKANAKRVAKIAQLKSEGKAIPKALLKPITYNTPGILPQHIGQKAEVATGGAHQASHDITKATGVVQKTPPPPHDLKPKTAGTGEPEKLGDKAKAEKPAPTPGKVVHGEATKVSHAVSTPKAEPETSPGPKTDPAIQKLAENKSLILSKRVKGLGVPADHHIPVDALGVKLGKIEGNVVHDDQGRVIGTVHTGGKYGQHDAKGVDGWLHVDGTDAAGKHELHAVWMGKPKAPEPVHAVSKGAEPSHVATKAAEPAPNKDVAHGIGWTAADFLKLPADKQNAVIKDLADVLKATDVSSKEHQVAEALHARYVGALHALPSPAAHKTTPKVEVKAPALPHPSAPASVKHATAVANGTAPGAKLAKVQLAAYLQLSKTDFKALPEGTQKKILADLTVAHGKFLDPKKKAEAGYVHEMLSGEKIGKAGAPKAEVHPVNAVAHELERAKALGAKGYNDNQLQAIKAAHNQPAPATALSAIMKITHDDFGKMSYDDRMTIKAKLAQLTGVKGPVGEHALIAHKLLTGTLKPVDTGPNEHGHNLGEQVAAHLGVQVGQSKGTSPTTPLGHTQELVKAKAAAEVAKQYKNGEGFTDGKAMGAVANALTPEAVAGLHPDDQQHLHEGLTKAAAELEASGLPATANAVRDQQDKLFPGGEPKPDVLQHLLDNVGKGAPSLTPAELADLAAGHAANGIHGASKLKPADQAKLEKALQDLTPAQYGGLTPAQKSIVMSAYTKMMTDHGPGPAVEKLAKAVSLIHGTPYTPPAKPVDVQDLTKIDPTLPANLKQAATFAKNHNAGNIDPSIDDMAPILAVQVYSKINSHEFDLLPAVHQKSILDSIAKFTPANTSTTDLKALADAKDKMLGISTLSPTPEKLGGAAAKATSKAAAKTGGKVDLAAPAKVDILGAFKMQPTGSQLKDPTKDAYDNVLAITHAFAGKPGFGDLSLEQVLKAIDEQHAKNLGVPNAGLLEQKVTSWLATPEGAAYAASATPKTSIVSGLKKDDPTFPPGAKPRPDGKTIKLPGPGGYSAKLTSKDFVARSAEAAQAEHDVAVVKSGKPWTPDQQQALKTYTSASGSMNNYLREDGAHVDPLTRQRVIDAQAGMRPLTSNHLLTRGTGWEQLPKEYRSVTEVAKLIGKTIEDPGFLSTSVGGGGFGGSVRLEIEAPIGTQAAFVKSISHFPHENEMLLAAGTKMKVLSVSQDGGQTVLRVRVVTPKK